MPSSSHKEHPMCIVRASWSQEEGPSWVCLSSSGLESRTWAVTSQVPGEASQRAAWKQDQVIIPGEGSERQGREGNRPRSGIQAFVRSPRQVFLVTTKLKLWHPRAWDCPLSLAWDCGIGSRRSRRPWPCSSVLFSHVLQKALLPKVSLGQGCNILVQAAGAMVQTHRYTLPHCAQTNLSGFCFFLRGGGAGDFHQI